jgi:hypothetical protein
MTTRTKENGEKRTYEKQNEMKERQTKQVSYEVREILFLS